MLFQPANAALREASSQSLDCAPAAAPLECSCAKVEAGEMVAGKTLLPQPRGNK